MRKPATTFIPRIFWILAAVTVIVWAGSPGYVVGWDLNVYKNAILSLRAGRDPYADGTAIQRIFHAHLAEHPNAPTPFTYVYSPLTLPLLRLFARIPFNIAGALYWITYALAAMLVLAVSWQFITVEERKVFRFLFPAALFFPGLLQQDVLFSGNVAYLAYGLLFSASYLGWTRGLWSVFYVLTVAISCVKAPLLIFLAVPLLSAKRQLFPTLLAGATGILLFVVQPYLWPRLFANYLDAVELQFSFNHDFSSSPNGLLADALYNIIPYKVTSVGFYLLYAVPLFLILLYLSNRYKAGALALNEWAPVMFCGVALLNPRIMEYDVAPLTMFMALILWRAFANRSTIHWTILRMTLLFAAVNALAIWIWRPTESVLLAGTVGAGLIHLARKARTLVPHSMAARSGTHPLTQGQWTVHPAGPTI